MLDLHNVELVCVDTSPRSKLALSAIEHSISKINFEKVTFFCNIDHINNSNNKINLINAPDVENSYSYSQFITHELHKYLTSKFVLIIQWDGFILNPDKWTDKFLEYDYIGAPWKTKVVGNGGFSLRSKKLFDTIIDNISEFDKNTGNSDELYTFKYNEDVQICRINRQLLESKNIKFCNFELANSFSSEYYSDYKNQFGYHAYNKNLPDWVKSRFTETDCLDNLQFSLIKNININQKKKNDIFNSTPLLNDINLISIKKENLMDKWYISQKQLIDRPKIIINCEQATGSGDKIHITPAIRECKKQNPDKEIVLLIDKTPEIFHCNPNVSYILPAYTTQIKYRNNLDTYIYLNWTFYEHHQYDHIVAPYFRYIIQDFGIETYDYSMEMFCNTDSKNKIDKCIEYLKNISSKPILVISPSSTFKNRTLPKELWQNIVDLLKDQYIIISVGSKTDFELNNVLDYRTKFLINELPYFIDHLDLAISINSGFLNILACTKKIKIIHLNVGEFPTNLFEPVRNNVLGWNCTTITHDCPLKEKCYDGHITESIFQEQLKENVNLYGNKYNIEVLKKYTAHHYCAKENDKHTCSQIVYDNFVKQIR